MFLVVNLKRMLQHNICSLKYTQQNFKKNKIMCQPHYMIYNTNNFMDNFLTFNADTIVEIAPIIISGIMTFLLQLKIHFKMVTE